MADFSAVTPAGFRTELSKLEPATSMKPLSGYYIDSGVGVANRTDGHNSIDFTPMPIPWNISIDTFSGYVEVAQASAIARYGIYSDDGSNQYPGSLVVDGGTVDCSTTGYKFAAFTAIDLAPGLYWLVAHRTGPTAATMPVTSHTSGPQFIAGHVLQYHTGWRQSDATTNWFGGYGSAETVDAALPATAPVGMTWNRYRSICGIGIA